MHLTVLILIVKNYIKIFDLSHVKPITEKLPSTQSNKLFFRIIFQIFQIFERQGTLVSIYILRCLRINVLFLLRKKSRSYNIWLIVT